MKEPPRCSRCHLLPRRSATQSYCRPCHNDKNREYEARVRQTLAEARAIVAARDAESQTEHEVTA